MAKEIKMDFSKDYAKLQEIVRWFEKEDFDLEEGVKKFEEGMILVKNMKKYLNTMENKIKELKANF